MIPAGWGGTGSVRFAGGLSFFEKRVVYSRSDAAMDKFFNDTLSTPAVFRSVRSPVANNPTMDDVPIPSFLRKRDQIIDHGDPQYWTESEHYEGLTPLGVSEWLRLMPVREWPTTYTGLRQMGLGAWMVDWLELAMASTGGSTHSEAKVVEAFLYVMAKREIQESPTRSEGFVGAFNKTVLRLRGAFAGGPSVDPSSVDQVLVEAMVAVLDAMTLSAWPDQVFALDSSPDQALGQGDVAMKIAEVFKPVAA